MIVLAVKSDGLANSTFRDAIPEKSHFQVVQNEVGYRGGFH